MTQLRRLDVSRLCFPNPPHSNGTDRGDDDPILENLQTLGLVENLDLSQDVCKRTPNIKELEVYYDFKNMQLDKEILYSRWSRNIGNFHKLEKLSCRFSYRHSTWRLIFPSSLLQLRLVNNQLNWDDLNVIALLPHLVDLELFGSIRGAEWNPIEQGFPSLKFLMIYGCVDLRKWNADSSHFPVLKHLFLECAYKLDEIPSAIGEIPTLEVIILNRCNEYAGISAVRILMEQEELGNDCLRVEIRLQTKGELERFRNWVQELGLTSNNLRLRL